MEFYTAQEFARYVRFCWNNLGDRFTAFGYNKRSASVGDLIEKRRAVGSKLTGRYCFRFMLVLNIDDGHSKFPKMKAGDASSH
jgi:hypothetical protein